MILTHRGRTWLAGAGDGPARTGRYFTTIRAALEADGMPHFLPRFVIVGQAKGCVVFWIL